MTKKKKNSALEWDSLDLEEALENMDLDELEELQMELELELENHEEEAQKRIARHEKELEVLRIGMSRMAVLIEDILCKPVVS